jgi:hypothetical protein
MFTSTSYVNLVGTQSLAANLLSEIGDILRVKAHLHGQPGGDSSNRYFYNFQLKIGSTALTFGYFISQVSELRINSDTVIKNNPTTGIFLEIDFVVTSLSPFVIMAVPRTKDLIYNIGRSLYTVGTSSSFFVDSSQPTLSQDSIVFSFGGSINTFTTGIDPTIANAITLEGKMTQVGTGGGFTPGYACPYLLIELLKKV